MRRFHGTAGATAPQFGVVLLVIGLGACGVGGAGGGGGGGHAGGGTGSGSGGDVSVGGHGGAGRSDSNGGAGSVSSGGAGGVGSGRGGSQPLPLTPEDVTGLAPGDALGQTYSGLFMFETLGPNICACRTGSCQDLEYNLLAIVSFSQTEGSLSMQRVRGFFRENACTGGVNQTGQFWCGTAAGGNLFLMTGQFSTMGGVPDALSMTARETLRGDDGRGHIVDCDIEQSETFLFLP